MLIITDWKWHFVRDRHVVQDILQLRQKGCPNPLYHFFKDPSNTHTRIRCCGSSILAGRVSYSLLFDAAQREAVLHGKIRPGGAPSAPETPDGIRNLKTIFPATRGFDTDGHHVQLCTEHMFRQHRFPSKFSGQCSHADSFLRSRTSYPLVRLILPHQTTFFGATLKGRYMKGVWPVMTTLKQRRRECIQEIPKEILRHTVLFPSRLQECTKQHGGHLRVQCHIQTVITHTNFHSCPMYLPVLIKFFPLFLKRLFYLKARLLFLGHPVPCS